ncbi:hypothetical protein [Metabacillus sediminilitoris]|uniref:hypothetical protein n=1 Tax=Metabacillus sediminilitoris TaxID=2567941 RepID=UPI0012D7C1AC|nr:hypothetical protein [Metabacillus sediminilitoris]QGQ45511.1 hypothetical protein GMB29_09775 [Metabacillus sediminilitoris]
MDHIQRKTDSNPFTDEEALSTVSNQEGNLEWKQFIQKELEKLENQEKDEGKEDSETTSSAKTEFTLSSLIEQIPLEKMIDSAIRIFNKKTEAEKTKPEKTEAEKTKPEKTEAEKTKPEKTVAEKTKPEKTKPEKKVAEKTKPEKTKPEKTVAEKTKPEKTKPEKTVAEKTKPEKTKPEKTKPEKTVAKKTKPEKTVAEKTKPEKTKAKKTEQKKQNRKKEIVLSGTYMNQEYDSNSLLNELKEKVKRRGQQLHLQRVEAEKEKALRDGKEKFIEAFKIPSSLKTSDELNDLILRLYELKKQMKNSKKIEE